MSFVNIWPTGDDRVVFSGEEGNHDFKLETYLPLYYFYERLSNGDLFLSPYSLVAGVLLMV
jgi:hypothetical protein